ncbi:DUF6192 family protein [Streptomyces niveus]|uniref:DUF6192 family protein n=1 Tax=Streptomyces niveus TaxID=193462 RepID=UPI0036CEB02A
MSFTVHRILAGIADEEERFAVILTPPPGRTRWTPDEANRRAGRQVVKPVTPQEKVSAIHTLATDEEVAIAVTGDLLRRPTVVAQVRQEDKVRAVEELTRDEGVAATVTGGLLRRPAVVAQVKQEERVRVVEELTRDEQVAAEVTTGLLRRPRSEPGLIPAARLVSPATFTLLKAVFWPTFSFPPRSPPESRTPRAARQRGLRQPCSNRRTS